MEMKGWREGQGEGERERERGKKGGAHAGMERNIGEKPAAVPR